MNNSENRQDPPGGDNENRRQILRNEAYWHALLHRAEDETVRFFRIYEKVIAIPEDEQDFDDRLDYCARQMGWHVSSEDDSGIVPAIEKLQNVQENTDGKEFPAVYSLHNLPECIAVSAIHVLARSRWRDLWKMPCAKRISPYMVTLLAETLTNAQRDLLLAIDAEDALEFGLAICLTKKAHMYLNRHFEAMESLPNAMHDENYTRHITEIRKAVMDLRDICLRIMRDARIELEKAQRR